MAASIKDRAATSAPSLRTARRVGARAGELLVSESVVGVPERRLDFKLVLVGELTYVGLILRTANLDVPTERQVNLAESPDGSRELHADYRLEVYKRLRDEMWACIDRVPGLWLQKFVLLGATIAFIIQFQKDIDAYGGVAKPLALCSLPCVAALLDAKILEYTIQARLISQFIVEHYGDIEVAVTWEKNVWGVERDPLVKYRSITSILVTMGPTMMLFILAAAAAGSGQFLYLYWVAAAIGIAIYIVLYLVVWRRIFARGIEHVA